MTRNLINTENPTRTAVITETGENRLYGDLLEDIDACARYLQTGKVVFIICNNDYPPLVCYLAALEARAVPLILNASILSDHVLGLIKAFQPQFIFAGNNFEADVPASKIYRLGDYWLSRMHRDTETVVHPDLAMLATTSGSTGSAKLVRLSFQNLHSNAKAIVKYMDIGEADRGIVALPISYSYGLSVINSHLLAGASLVLSNASLMEKQFWQTMKEFDITSFAGVPYHYEMLLRLRWERMDLPALKKMTQAGGRLAPDKMRRIAEECANRGIRFWAMYGQTEASPRISYLPSEDAMRKLGSIGVAIPDGRLWVRDESTGQDISGTDQVGELVYEGPNVCLGYAEDADDLSLEDQNHGVLFTGDLARCDAEGYFYIEGRKKRFLKIYGNRISLDCVEAFIQGQVGECALIGEDDQMMIFVVGGDEINMNALREDVAAFAGVNAIAIRLKKIDAMPRLSSGKVDYLCLTNSVN